MIYPHDKEATSKRKAVVTFLNKGGFKVELDDIEDLHVVYLKDRQNAPIYFVATFAFFELERMLIGHVFNLMVAEDRRK